MQVDCVTCYGLVQIPLPPCWLPSDHSCQEWSPFPCFLYQPGQIISLHLGHSTSPSSGVECFDVSFSLFQEFALTFYIKTTRFLTCKIVRTELNSFETELNSKLKHNLNVYLTLKLKTMYMLSSSPLW